MVAQSRCERVVAQYFADVTIWSSISRPLWSFLEANVPVVVSLMVPLITPIDEIQVEPRLMMAALITGTCTENLSRNGKGAVFVHFPESQGARRLKKTTDVPPVVRDGSGSPKRWEGPSGEGKAQSKKSSIVLILSRLRQRQAEPMKSPATK